MHNAEHQKTMRRDDLNRQRINVAGVMAILGSTACWTIGPLLIRPLAGHFDFWTQNFYRYLTAGLILLPGIVVAYRRRTFDPALWRRAIVPSCFNVIMQSCWVAAFYHIHPGLLTLLSKLSVLWTVLFSLILFREERPLLRSVFFWAGLALSSIGLIGVIVVGHAFEARASAIGIALALSASCAWGCYTVSAKATFRHTPSHLGFAVISLYTTIGLALAAMTFSDPFANLPSTPLPWLFIILSSALAIACAHVLYYAALKRIGATVPALLLLLQPLAVLPLSMLFFGETVILGQWLWGLVLLAGAVCAIMGQKVLRPVMFSKPS